MNAHRFSRALALAAGLALAPSAARPVEAQYSGRLQAPWVKDHVAGILIGLETREPIGGVPDQPAEGPRVIETRDWMFTGMAGIGLNFDPPPDHDYPLLLQAHAGVLYRLDGGLEPRVGAVLVLYLPAGVAGPAARLEVMDVAAVQAGWMFDAGLHVGLEVAYRFLLDLAGV